MKAYNFNVRTLHAICFVLALGLLVAGLQAFFVANAATLAGAASVYPGHAIAKMACGLFLGACAWFDALEKPRLGEANDVRLAMAKSDLAQSALRVASAWDEASKSASVNQTSGSGSNCNSCAQRSLSENHRARLEELAMHCLGNAALPHEERFTPAEAGARIREAIDALQGTAGICAQSSSGHSVECLYEYALARLNLSDTPEMRVLFWDAHEALTWDANTDHWIQPQRQADKCETCNAARATAS